MAGRWGQEDFLRGSFDFGVLFIIPALTIKLMEMLSDSSPSSPSDTAPQLFHLGPLDCLFKTKQTVAETQTHEPSLYQLLSLPPSLADNIIHKLLTFRYADHTLTIEDEYALTPPMPSASQPKEEKEKEGKEGRAKVMLFRERGGAGKGDKKNIAKNVVTAFANYLRELQLEGEQLQECTNELRGLIEKTRYNNQLIADIVNSPHLRSYFRDFLTLPAHIWVQQSKLKNKPIHQQALGVYEKLCDEREGEAQRNWQMQRVDPEHAEHDHDQNEYYFQSGINHELEDEIKHFK